MGCLKFTMVCLCGVAILSFCGCSTVPKTPEARDVLGAEVNEAIALFKNKDPEIQRFFGRSEIHVYAGIPC
jgi:hypothetical protein